MNRLSLVVYGGISLIVGTFSSKNFLQHILRVICCYQLHLLQTKIANYNINSNYYSHQFPIEKPTASIATTTSIRNWKC
ncbi:hypothetical protein HanRHA438_Chr04g0164691 [Helianthus annuus]|nr:hypothetical protein HanRHA438_Chr04g0164691 [Helianthus annuus]